MDQSSLDTSTPVKEDGHRERKARIMDTLNTHPFKPSWWLTNNHAQTVGARYLRKESPPPLRLERWETPDGDLLRVHRCDGDPAKPIAVLLHGLEGSVESPYIAGLIVDLHREGWNVLAMEHRSCGEMNRARRMYHSGETTDLAFVVRKTTEERPGADIYVAGYSLGGNQVGKWLGDECDAVPKEVRGAAIVSAPYELLVSGPSMDTGFTRLYVSHFLRSLIPKAIEKERQFPGCVDIEAVKRSKTFDHFDTHATAALHGFRDATDYYTQVACGQFLKDIKIPTLLISAADDPFNPASTLPTKTADNSPYLYPYFPEKGGHVGFVYGSAPWTLKFWAEEHIVRFFLALSATKS